MYCTRDGTRPSFMHSARVSQANGFQVLGASCIPSSKPEQDVAISPEWHLGNVWAATLRLQCTLFALNYIVAIIWQHNVVYICCPTHFTRSHVTCKPEQCCHGWTPNSKPIRTVPVWTWKRWCYCGCLKVYEIEKSEEMIIVLCQGFEKIQY